MVAERERKQEFTILLQEIKGLVADIEKDTASTLATFRSQQKEMVAAFRSELVGFSRDLRKEVSAMLAEFSSDQQQSHAEWENMTRVMTAKRASKQTSSSGAKKDASTSV